jgi:hypothetical protein
VLNCNGNPLHPNKVIGDRHAEDIRRSIRLASRLGHNRVVTMSGLPGGGNPARRGPVGLSMPGTRQLSMCWTTSHFRVGGKQSTPSNSFSTERKSQPSTFPGRASLMQGDVVALDINVEARSREG